MAEQPPSGGSKSAGRMKWIIILSLAGLGAYLYLRSRKAAAAQPQSAASQGSTNPNPSVPVYQTSGTYNGPYTPNIINNGVQQPAGAMPGGAITSPLTQGYYDYGGGMNINSSGPVNSTVTVAQPQTS